MSYPINDAERFDVDGSASASTTTQRIRHAYRANSAIFSQPPVDPSGRRFDLSDRLLMCSSSNMRNELVVGGTDHALYAIDVLSTDSRKKPTTMYSKKFGHTDWVTCCSHLADGRVVSGCMWKKRNGFVDLLLPPK